MSFAEPAAAQVAVVAVVAAAAAAAATLHDACSELAVLSVIPKVSFQVSFDCYLFAAALFCKYCS